MPWAELGKKWPDDLQRLLKAARTVHPGYHQPQPANLGSRLDEAGRRTPLPQSQPTAGQQMGAKLQNATVKNWILLTAFRTQKNTVSGIKMVLPQGEKGF